MNVLTENWDNILKLIKEDYDLSEVSIKTWLKPLEVYSIEGNIITIIVPLEQFGLNYIAKKYTLPLQVTISEFLGIDDCEIRFILPDDVPSYTIPDPSPQAKAQKDPPQNARAKAAHLDPRYTFDTFIVGNNNKLAQAAALAVAESPGKVYNPLFIYGGAGLGKTHLMHSIAHFIIENDQNSKVLYVTSEEFTNELIKAIRNGSNLAMANFREKYRNIDVLLVDDIQFIIGKDSTQEEFFHTFNSLHGANKAIIMSSDKPPKDMDVLEERFRSRFEWGLIADITQPDYETRMAILHKKEEDDGILIDEEIIKYIAENINSNIRELEGALNKVLAFARIDNKDITLDYAKDILKDIITPDAGKVIDPNYIIDVVAEHFNLSPADIIGKQRSTKCVVPRQICMYLCRELVSSMPLKTIGGFLGGRDHSTVLHGCNKIESDMTIDDNLKNTVNIIRMKINPPAQ